MENIPDKNLRRKNVNLIWFILISTFSFFITLFLGTSSMIRPSALNLSLPNPTVTIIDTAELEKITINNDGSFWNNGIRIKSGELEKTIKKLQLETEGKKLNLVISPQKNAPTNAVVEVMETARVLEANGILTVAK